ncbi:hypothetical protein [Wolbachia pipientis]|nr:hypothetical protein [Wolbachia pipientis]
MVNSKLKCSIVVLTLFASSVAVGIYSSGLGPVFAVCAVVVIMSALYLLIKSQSSSAEILTSTSIVLPSAPPPPPASFGNKTNVTQDYGGVKRQSSSKQKDDTVSNLRSDHPNHPNGGTAAKNDKKVPEGLKNGSISTVLSPALTLHEVLQEALKKRRLQMEDDSEWESKYESEKSSPGIVAQSHATEQPIKNAPSNKVNCVQPPPAPPLPPANWNAKTNFKQNNGDIKGQLSSQQKDEVNNLELDLNHHNGGAAAKNDKKVPDELFERIKKIKNGEIKLKPVNKNINHNKTLGSSKPWMDSLSNRIHFEKSSASDDGLPEDRDEWGDDDVRTSQLPGESSRADITNNDTSLLKKGHNKLSNNVSNSNNVSPQKIIYKGIQEDASSSGASYPECESEKPSPGIGTHNNETAGDTLQKRRSSASSGYESSCEGSRIHDIMVQSHDTEQHIENAPSSNIDCVQPYDSSSGVKPLREFFEKLSQKNMLVKVRH